MKFIKTADSNYIRVDKIVGFTLDININGVIQVDADFEDGEFECLNRFDTKAEAQAWLDALVDKINTEE